MQLAVLTRSEFVFNRFIFGIVNVASQQCPGLQRAWNWRILAGMLVVLCWAGQAQAAAVDQANAEFLRQQERERQLRQTHDPDPDVRMPIGPAAAPDALPEAETPCFNIQQLTLVGEESDRFQWALQAARQDADGKRDLELPRCLGAGSINRIMGRVQNAIIAHGYVTTRVLAQPQDLNSGRLILTLIPGRVREIRLGSQAESGASIGPALPSEPGELLNLRDLEQGLENFKRVPTATAGIQIEPAAANNAEPGESDLVVDWRQAFPMRFTFGLDDAGSETTGKYQGNVTVSLDNWLSLNDLFYVSLNRDLGGGDEGDRGSEGQALHYSFPIDYWLLTFALSENSYHQSVAGAQQTYEYSGDSENGEVRLSRMLYRDAVRKFSLGLLGWTRASRNFIDDTEIEVQRRRMAGWGMAATYREFIRQAALDIDLGYRRGTGADDALPAPEELFGEGTSRPEILTLDAGFNLPFVLADQPLRYNLRWRAQWNGTPLVPQDRFGIGSRYTVRGFDGESLLAADRGWLVRNDLGWQPGAYGQELYLGLDYGEVSGPSADRLLGTTLSGLVLGLRGGYRALNYDLFGGRPLQQPDGFITADNTAGFAVSLSF